MSKQRLPTKLPNLTLRGSTYHVVLRLPEDVKRKIGRSVWQQTTGESDIMKAWEVARPLLIGWKKEIDAARRGESMTQAQIIAQARLQFRKALARGDDPWNLVSDLLDTLGIEEDIVEGEDASLPSPSAVKRAMLDQIDGTATPLTFHLDAWISQLGMRSREVALYSSDVREFLKAHPTATVEGLNGAVVQTWIGTLTHISPNTIQRKLAALRNFWGYLQAHEIALTSSTPFSGRKLPKRRIGDIVTRRDFKPVDIMHIHAEALSRGDQPLADLIWLAAHTGARIEELCTLQLEHVQWDGDMGILTIPGTKTSAAARVVPIHSACWMRVKRLTTDAKADGYLIPSTAHNRYNERSATLGRRFSRLKSTLGYGPEQVFHSIRKTVSTLFEDAQVPEGIAADILGHEKTTMTYGLYSGGASLTTKRDAIEKAIHYTVLPAVIAQETPTEAQEALSDA